MSDEEDGDRSDNGSVQSGYDSPEVLNDVVLNNEFVQIRKQMEENEKKLNQLAAKHKQDHEIAKKLDEA